MMPSFEYELDKKSEVGSDFITRVNEELQRALVTEKQARKITQQEIADTLEINRSVVNRRFMGLENLTVRSIAETLWAIGWEPLFKVKKIAPQDGENERAKPKENSFKLAPPPPPSSPEKPLSASGFGKSVALERV